MKVECKDLDYDFEVSESYILRDTYFGSPIKVKGYKAIINVDSDVVLAIVSDKYQLVKHSEIVNMTRQILAERGCTVDEDIQLTKDGARMFYHIDYEKPVVLEDVEGFHDVDSVSHGLRITNSYDGSMRIFVEGTGFRHLCKNVLTFPFDLIKRFVSAKLIFEQVGRKHVGLRSLIGFEDYLSMWLDLQDSAPDMFKDIQSKTLSPEDFVKFDKIISKLPETYRERIVANIVNSGSSNLWTVYNAVTEATTHVREENKSIETLRNHSLVAAKVLNLGI